MLDRPAGLSCESPMMIIAIVVIIMIMIMIMIIMIIIVIVVIIIVTTIIRLPDGVRTNAYLSEVPQIP